MKTAAVMGAGIQGVCVALMLNKYKYRVLLIDRGNDIMNFTSKTGEGKIHLGFVYGLDKSLKTAEKLTLDALHFSNYIEYLVDDKPDWQSLKSIPFHYLVAHDSMLSDDEIEEYFENIQRIYKDFVSDRQLNYLGSCPDRVFAETSIPARIKKTSIRKSFRTEEVAIHTSSLKSILKNKLLSEPVTLLLNSEITEIKTVSDGFQIESTSLKGINKRIKADIVINCLWANKLKFDSMMGLDTDNYCVRLKYGLFIYWNSNLHNIPSFTVIQGPYGDFVDFSHFNEAYISWYPSTMRELKTNGLIPLEWNPALNNVHTEAMIQDLKFQNYRNYKNIIQNFKPFKIKTVRAGIILAQGSSDISEKDSKLHCRSESPIKMKDGYYSINTGKYTSAPYNTLLLERMLIE